MSSKCIFMLCLFLAMSTLLVVSEVAARDLAETEKKTEGENGLNDAKYGGNGGYGPGNGGYNGGYGPGNGGYGPGNGGYGPGGGGNYHRCRYGCCRREYYGRGCRQCCHYAGQVAVTEQPEATTHN